MKNISIFGSTGSIGTNAVKILLNQKNDFNVVVLTGGKNLKELAKQSILLKPKHIVIADHELLGDLKKLLNMYKLRSEVNLEDRNDLSVFVDLNNTKENSKNIDPRYHKMGTREILNSNNEISSTKKLVIK